MVGHHRLFDRLEEETSFGLSTKTTMPHKRPAPQESQAHPLLCPWRLGDRLDVLQFLRFRRKEMRGRENCVDQ